MNKSIKQQVTELENKRKKILKEIDAELAKLRVLCEHENKRSHPSRPGDSSIECLDCGKWW